MKHIRSGNILLASIGQIKDIPKGKMFHVDGDSPLQMGTFRLPKGEILEPHIHKVRERNFTTKTLEFFYVVSGAMRATFYTNEKKMVCFQILKAGDWIMMFDGGHGFKVLREDTVFIECKLGPWDGSVANDKQKFIDEEML